MLTLVFCLRRRDGMSREAFQRYWHDHHGPLMRERMAAFGARRYVQLHTIDGPEAETIASTRGTLEPYDGVAVVTWDDLDTFRRYTGSDDGRVAGREMYQDELNFIDLARSTIFLTEERFEAPGAAG